MRAFEIPAYGLDHVRLSERSAKLPGPGQVSVALRAASLNYRDLLTVMGAYGRAYKLPIVPLSDGCGVIDALGDGVTQVKIGDRVTPLFFPAWLDGPPRAAKLAQALGGPLDGCLQDQLILDANSVVPVPDHLTDAEAATLPCAALTAWRALVVEGGLKAGDVVLVQGTGGVSIFALQFAKAFGARVIATSSQAAKMDRLLALGADHVINYREHPDWGQATRAWTGGQGVDHVIEVGGAETLKESLKAVRVGGHVAIVGVLSGPSKDLALGSLIGGNVRLQGLSVGSRAMFEDMNRAITATRLKPVIDRILPFAHAVEALHLMQSGGHFGKICLDHTA